MISRLADQRVQSIAAQLVGAVVLVAVAALLAHTLDANLARLNLSTGFGFLLRPAGMRMGESVIPFEPTDSFLWAMVAAGLNTIRVSVAAIVLTTILGTAVGVLRLGANPLLRSLTSAYVELFRNTPLLLQVLFWSAILLKLPGVRDAIPLGNVGFLSQRGLQVPALTLSGGWGAAWPGLVAGIVIAAVLVVATRRIGTAVLAGLAIVTTVLAWQGSLTLQYPVRRLFGFTGGLTLTPEFCALLLALTAYHGAFIAEIVRGGILSVPRGQWEAAGSLGLRNGVILRRIVLPQALRVILPAITTQFTGVIKNSSLAVAIGYPDLFWSVSTAINVTGHAVEGVMALMAGYLVLTLGTSGAMSAWHASMLRHGAAR